MKVILQRDVAKIGRRFEVVEVPDGFALNKLIPQGDAKAATASNIKSVAAKQKKDGQNKEQVLANFKMIGEKLNKELLQIKVTANKEGHLFKAINADDVVLAAKEVDIDLPKDYVVIEEVIKTLGDAKINLRCLEETIPLTINILAK